MTPAISAHEMLPRGRHRLAFVGLATIFFMLALAGLAYACVPWGGNFEAQPVPNNPATAPETDPDHNVHGNPEAVMEWCDSSQGIEPAQIMPSGGTTDPDIKITMHDRESSCTQTGKVVDTTHFVSAVNSGFSQLAPSNLVGGSSFSSTSVDDTDRDRDCMTRLSTQQPDLPAGNFFYIDNMSWNPVQKDHDPSTTPNDFFIDDISLNSNSGVGGLAPSNGNVSPGSDVDAHVPWDSVAGVCLTSTDTSGGHDVEGIMIPVEILDYRNEPGPGTGS
jgi:hypothetical protein